MMALHSRYNPVREAERYIDALDIVFQPLFIVVSEPGESWLADILRKRFPDACIIAMRYDTKQFTESDYLWDAVWRPENSVSPEVFLFNIISDEHLPLTVFIPWKPSDSLWPAEAAHVWNGIASLIRLQKDVMFTRAHFGKRWLSNMIKNIVTVRTSARFATVTKPIFLALAGPSLESQFPFDHDNFFVCAASSALSCLMDKGCKPDLCISTDGGYWALPLFRDIPESVPVAFPLEAAVPSRVLENNHATFLSYGSALEREFFSLSKIVPENASRNGTVAGTAVQFLLSHSTSSVYAAGLDLQNSSSFSHARPHQSLLSVEYSTDRIKPLSHELFLRNINSASLDTYAAWFMSRQSSFSGRFFRLSPEGRKIKGIPVVDIGSLHNTSQNAKEKIDTQPIADVSTRKGLISSFFTKFIKETDICRSIGDVAEKKKYFTDTMAKNSSYPELLQLISYTGYVNTLKNLSRNDVDSGTLAGIDCLCDESKSFATLLLSKVQAYGG